MSIPSYEIPIPLKDTLGAQLLIEKKSINGVSYIHEIEIDGDAPGFMDSVRATLDTMKLRYKPIPQYKAITVYSDNTTDLIKGLIGAGIVSRTDAIAATKFMGNAVQL